MPYRDGWTMDLNELRSFVAVARHHHFTRAAEELHIGQPAVSQHVRRLERELGVQLLTRTSRMVELTEAGELLLHRAERALAELEAGQDELADLRGLRRGRLTVGAMQSLAPFDLAATLATYRAASPEIDIRVVEDAGRNLLAGVSADRLDLAFAPVEAGAGLPAGLAAHELFTERLVAIVGRGSALAGRKRVELADLADEPFVFLQGGTGLRTSVERVAQAAGFVPRVGLETNELTRVVELVAEGLGVSVVSAAVGEANRDRIAVLELRPAIERRVALVWRAERRPSPAAAAFLAQVRGDAPK
jgi:DNA-binding transcriptional LysR family regulator